MNENLIPQISQKIEKVLRAEKLTANVLPQEFIRKTKAGKHRYFSICLASDKKKIVFYARIQKNKDARNKVRKEATFAKELKNKTFQKNLPFAKFIPQYCKGKIERDFEWFEREFIKEEPLGDNELLEKKITRERILQIIKFLLALKETKLSLFKNIPLGKFPLKDYKDIPYILLPLKEKEIISEEEYLVGKKFIKDYFSLFKKEHKYLSHGDFNLGNIIFTKKGLKIIDWESMEINNFAYDLSYLITHLWQGKKWQRKELINGYCLKLPKREKKIFTILFRGNIIHLTAGGIFARPKEIKKSLLPKRKKFFQKLLKASLESFEKILTI